MRELYLHIGLPKTGTSYLQSMLARNADRLLAAGIGLGPYVDPVNGKSMHMRRAIRDEGLRAVMTRLAASPGETLVISSEHFAPFLLDRRVAEAFRDAARPHFALRIVIFLRRQDRLKESLFSQEVKNWYAGDIQDENTFDYDHDRRVADLEAVFGRENVRVLIYREGAANDILAAFFTAIGATVPRADLREVGQQNVSLHRRKVLFLSRVPKPDPTVQDISMLLTGVVTKTRSIADDGGRFLMSPRQRHDLVARHRAGNAALVARHRITDAGDFTELPDPDAAWAPPAPISRTEFLAVSAEAFGSCLLHRRNRYGLSMSGKLARFLPRMGYRMFIARAPYPPAVPAASDMLPIPDLDPTPPLAGQDPA